jgi:hypothetical protein
MTGEEKTLPPTDLGQPDFSTGIPACADESEGARITMVEQRKNMIDILYILSIDLIRVDNYNFILDKCK